MTGGRRKGNGDPYLTHVEVLSSNGTFLCVLPGLPVARAGHSQDGLVSCGGSDGTDIIDEQTPVFTCATFIRTEWVTSITLSLPRFGHASWSTSSGLYLLGGNNGTSELVSGAEGPSTLVPALDVDEL